MKAWRCISISGLVALATGLLGPASTRAESPWLPLDGELVGTFSWSRANFDKLWQRKTSIEFPYGHLDQVTYTLSLEYGLRDDLALDLTSGFSRSDVSGNGVPLRGDDGITDTDFGLRWRALDEFDYERWYVPTVTLRLGGLLAGSYSSFFPTGVGDGRSGVLGGISLGKVLPHDFAVFANLGYRHRAGRAPANTYGSAGISKTVLGRFGATVQYVFEHSLDGTNLGDPGFRPSRANELQQSAQSLDVALSYADRKGRYWSVFTSRVFDGRNFAQDHIFGASISVPFEL